MMVKKVHVRYLIYWWASCYFGCCVCAIQWGQTVINWQTASVTKHKHTCQLIVHKLKRTRYSYVVRVFVLPTFTFKLFFSAFLLILQACAFVTKTNNKLIIHLPLLLTYLCHKVNKIFKNIKWRWLTCISNSVATRILILIETKTCYNEEWIWVYTHQWPKHYLTSIPLCLTHDKLKKHELSYAKIAPVDGVTPFKVIQGHWFCYQSKVCMRLSISY